MESSKLLLVGLIVLSLEMTACTYKIPAEALQLSEKSLAQRQIQTRIFETRDESELLIAVSAVLQDLGFTLDESETKLGVIVASKDRDATEAGQIVAAVLFGVLTGTMLPIDKTQKMRASIVTRPVEGDNPRTAVRVTFQRIVWNTMNEVSKIESLNDPKAYQEFFDKLSKAVFLEAHTI